jgi:predicted nucleotidyltransferase
MVHSSQRNREHLSESDRDLARRLDDALAAVPEVVFGYLYGSRAKGRARRDSDVDVALMLTPIAARDAPFERIQRYAPPLMVVAGTDLDLVFLNDAPSLLAHRVLRDGILIHEKDTLARIRFQASTVTRYLDTKPMREIFISAAVTRAREGRRLGRPRDPREALGVLGRARD